MVLQCFLAENTFFSSLIQLLYRSDVHGFCTRSVVVVVVAAAATVLLIIIITITYLLINRMLAVVLRIMKHTTVACQILVTYFRVFLSRSNC